MRSETVNTTHPSERSTGPVDLTVSIGITCFNAEKTISRAVYSALNQTRPALEILILDDASTDSSWSILRSLAEKDSRIRLIQHEKNMGYPAGLNTLLDHARGIFFAVFDDDDESVRDRIETQVRRLLEYERKHSVQRVLCYGNRKVVESDGAVSEVLGIGRKPPEPSGEVVAESILALLKTRPYIWGEFGSCTLMARTGVLKALGGFDEKFRRMAEWDLAIRFARHGGHFISVDVPVITQYITKTPDKGGRIALDYALRLRKKYRSYLKAKRIYGLSLMVAYLRFHYAKRNRLRYRILAAVAALMYPGTFGKQLLMDKVCRYLNRHDEPAWRS